MASQSVGLLVLQFRETLLCCFAVSIRISLRASHVVAAGTGGEVEDTVPVGWGDGVLGGIELVGNFVDDGTGWDVAGTGTVTALVGWGDGMPGGIAELVENVVDDGAGWDVAGTGIATASVGWGGVVGGIKLVENVLTVVTWGLVIVTSVTSPTALGDTKGKEVG